MNWKCKQFISKWNTCLEICHGETPLILFHCSVSTSVVSLHPITNQKDYAMPPIIQLYYLHDFTNVFQIRSYYILILPTGATRLPKNSCYSTIARTSRTLFSTLNSKVISIGIHAFEGLCFYTR